MSEQGENQERYDDGAVMRRARRTIVLGDKEYEVREPSIALQDELQERYEEVSKRQEALEKSGDPGEGKALRRYLLDTVLMTSEALTADREYIENNATMAQVMVAYFEIAELFNDPLGLIAAKVEEMAATVNRAQRRAGNSAAKKRPRKKKTRTR